MPILNKVTLTAIAAAAALTGCGRHNAADDIKREPKIYANGNQPANYIIQMSSAESINVMAFGVNQEIHCDQYAALVKNASSDPEAMSKILEMKPEERDNVKTLCGIALGKLTLN
jgi:hypothetical protein